MTNTTVSKSTTLNAVSFLTLFVTFFLITGTLGSTAIAQSSNSISVLAPAPQPLSMMYAPGYDVTSVDAVDFQGHYAGGLRQVGVYSWEGYNRHGHTTYQYQETRRDEWIIELFNPARNLYFTIDLHSSIIRYHEAHSPLELIAFNIAYYDTQAKGFNVNTVDILSFSGHYLGQFTDIGHGSWAETNAHGQETFAFKERSRSEWTVDLYDASRSVYIRLDLRNNVIKYKDATQAFDLYNIGSTFTFDQLLN